jgi:hypothetical protein
VLDDSPALTNLFELIKQIVDEKENARIRQEIMDKLDATINDINSTV